MAIPAQAQNWTSNTLTTAEEMLQLMAFIRLHNARAILNNLTAVLTDGELAAHDAFKHLTQAELTDAYTVFGEYLTWMGDPAVAASRAAKLAKLAG